LAAPMYAARGRVEEPCPKERQKALPPLAPEPQLTHRKYVKGQSGSSIACVLIARGGGQNSGSPGLWGRGIGKESDC